MRVIRFPGAAEAELAGREAGEQIDEALAGELAGEEAFALRELREDVRALAPGLDAEFERELQAWVEECSRWRASSRRGLRGGLAAARERLSGTPRRLVALGGTGVVVAAVVVGVVAISGGSGSINSPSSPLASSPAVMRPRHRAKVFGDLESTTSSSSATKARAKVAPSSGEEKGPASGAGDFGSAAAPIAPHRLQRLGASVTLAPHGAEGVQEASDAVTQLAADDGGYVESSQVQVRHEGQSEAQLHLSIPSAKLAGAIAALGRIAPLRDVSQESQDITSSYDASKRQLSDDEAVRRALLRALSAATTEGTIDSLRDRLSSNREALSHDRERLGSISHAAATSQLEVAITSSGAATTGSSTLDRGLHDAGHVLALAGAGALVALAVLVPLALLAVAFDALRRAWRRRVREAALER